MTARAVPAEPAFKTASEREVWDELVRALPDEATVLANVRLTDERKDHEADLIVLRPGAGVVVVEVKGGSVFIDGGSWWQKRSGDTVPIHPVDQARDGKYALRHYVERDPRWRDSSRTRIRWAHSVVVPYSDLHDDFATPDCPRWCVHGRGDMGALAERITEVALRQESGHRVPSEDDCELIVEILQGRHLPVPDPTAEADERAVAADRLTQEQAALLKVTRLLNRVEVRGGAGSGKTVMALTQAKELTRGRTGVKPQRVALVCYSIGLAEYFKRQLAGVPRKQRPAFVGTFADLGREWGAPTGSREDSDFWEHELPRRMGELAGELPDGRKFDAVIVDEAQDFADAWWTPLVRALKDEETGGLFVYSDENQRIFARFGQPPVPLVPLVLDHNLRNTRQIADVFGPLAPMRMTCRGGDGPDVTFVPASADDAVGLADEQVDLLMDEGWKTSDIALLTTGKRHPVQRERQEALGQDGYWQSFWEDDDVFYGHVLGCKGLERRAVVLCVNESDVRERSRERLYVGLSRATDRLVVVGEPDVVREMGGDEVAKRLGLAHA